MTYTTMIACLDATWTDQPVKVRRVAARYYIGAESIETLRALADKRPCHKHYEMPPVLTKAQVEFIINMR